MNLLNKLQDVWLSLKLGVRVKTANDGNAIEQVTIKYKDVYLFVDIDYETSEPTGDFGWSDDPTMNPTVSLREIWTATPPKKEDSV